CFCLMSWFLPFSPILPYTTLCRSLTGDLAAVELGGQQVAGHVRPAQVLEGAGLLGEDRVAGEDHHPVLAGELPEAPGIARPVGGAVLVEVVAAGHPGVDRGGEGVGVEDRALPVLRDLEVLRAEEVDARAVLVVVELVEQDHVGVVELDDLRDRADLRVRTGGEVLEQRALLRPVQGDVVGGDPQVLEAPPGTGGLRGGLGHGRQAEARGSSRGERSTTGHAWSHASIVHARRRCSTPGCGRAVPPLLLILPPVRGWRHENRIPRHRRPGHRARPRGERAGAAGRGRTWQSGLHLSYGGPRQY